MGAGYLIYSKACEFGRDFSEPSKETHITIWTGHSKKKKYFIFFLLKLRIIIQSFCYCWKVYFFYSNQHSKNLDDEFTGPKSRNWRTKPYGVDLYRFRAEIFRLWKYKLLDCVYTFGAIFFLPHASRPLVKVTQRQYSLFYPNWKGNQKNFGA